MTWRGARRPSRKHNNRPPWVTPGAEVWVYWPSARGGFAAMSGEVAHLYAGGCTVMLDRIPGLPKAFLYSPLSQDKRSLEDKGHG